jgi:hypothetical protein
MNRISRFTSLPRPRRNAVRPMKRAIAGSATTLVVAGGLGLTCLGLGAGTAQAVAGPYHWCPGQPLWNPYYPAGRDLAWDMKVCHTWYYVYYHQGNVPYKDGTPSDVWDGDNPPAPPPINCGPLPCAIIP